MSPARRRACVEHVVRELGVSERKACTVLGHRAAEFIRFLRLIDKQTPPELDLHLILDNYAAHKTEAVKRWLARHPRFHVHFTPTSASWINAVEGLFATLTKRRFKRGVFRSVIELNQARDGSFATPP